MVQAAGVQADIRCISELGGLTSSVITSITVQNPHQERWGVDRYEAQHPPCRHRGC